MPGTCAGLSLSIYSNMKAILRFLNGHTIVSLMAIFLSLHAAAQTDSVYTGVPHARDSLQKKKKERNDDWKEKVTFGGNFQLQFGTFTFIYLSPTIGYIPFEKLNVGVGVIYNFISLDYGSYGKYTQSIWGGHSYARYFITDGFFVQGQYDMLRQPNVYSTKADAKTWVEYMMVGGGFRQPIGNKAALSSTILYNVTPSSLSIYSSRLVIQFGFMSTF